MSRTIVFDVETKKEFAEVGGAHNRHLLGVSVIGVWDSSTDAFTTYEEHEILKFGQVLRAADCVVTFNGEHFDLPVIQPYLPFDTSSVPSLDIMKHLEHTLGHRVSLDSCAEATFGTHKSGDGLQAIRWYRQGEIEKVKRYCLDDVKITKMLWEYGCEHGQVFFTGKDGSKRAVPVSWGMGTVDHGTVRQQIEEAHRLGKRVEIEYVSTVVADGNDHRNRRQIDVIAIREDMVDAFCYLRNDQRRFSLDRITDVKLLEEAAAEEHRVGQHALF
ncbi:MAG: ribonuclease H-like domain-containing protein [Candidatus Uhrbacteria bacterium]